MKFVIPKSTHVLRAPDDDKTPFTRYLLKADAVCDEKPRFVTEEGVAFIEHNGWVYQVREDLIQPRMR